MRVIPPIEILDAHFTSSDATEPWAPAAYAGGTTYAAGDIIQVAADFSIYKSLAASNTGNTPNVSPLWWTRLGPTELAYNSGTTYALGDTVSSATTHRVYESLAAGNIGNPLPVSPETTTTKWLDIGPNNRWAMFDLERNTKTIFASPLVVQLAPGVRIRAIAMLGLDATSVFVEMDDVVGSPQNNHYSADVNLQERTDPVTDWYDYFFLEFGNKAAFVLFDLPRYAGDILTVTVTNTGGPAAVGALVIGTDQYLGETEHGAESDALNFSVIDRDFAGNLATLVPRRSIPKVNQLVKAQKTATRDIFNLRTALNAVPAVWTSLDDSDDDWFEPFLILGIYRKFTINAADPVYADISLDVEEI
ncbi:MAG: hypothetical protein NUV75_01990 [Gallionella sp.]|nr:hypothetical protein [Gallionella sp.]